MKSKLALIVIFIYTTAFTGDTTNAKYKSGYAFGELLPFSVMAIIFVWLIWRNYKRGKQS